MECNRGPRGAVRRRWAHPDDTRGLAGGTRAKAARDVTNRGQEEFVARFATQNIGTLKGREDLVLDWAQEAQLDILALQEVHLDIGDRPEFSRKAVQWGYRVFYGHRDIDMTGAVTRGWPCWCNYMASKRPSLEP